MKIESKDFPPATLRTLQILDYFMADPSPKTLKTISESLNIPFTSLYRIVMCMQEYRYLVEDPTKPNHFRLGYKMRQFSDIVFSEKNLVKTALPFMREVASELNQACQLCTLTENGICTVEQCLPRSAITYITELNETIPINVSASGKILTALLPEKERERFLRKSSEHFRQNTPNTITDLDLLKMHLEEIAQQGYGTDSEEYAEGIGCVAVPIFDSEQKPVAAIGTTGPIEFYQKQEVLQATLAFLQKSALEISKRLS
ncbi:MAG: IclR family transcriptional regulator [Lachnospiraceae bacterium]|nr:IclR family transcriptional regulator [Lachnospiraceae bacterium]